MEDRRREIKREWEREACRDEEREVVEELDTLAEKSLYFLNILLWFLFHHTDRPHSNLALHTKRAVCTTTFSYNLRTLL